MNFALKMKATIQITIINTQKNESSYNIFTTFGQSILNRVKITIKRSLNFR